MDRKILLKKDMKEKQELVNIILDRFLPRKDEYPKDLHKAMRYSVFAGGKRLRPYLTMTAFEMFNSNIELITPVAAGIEMIHTYSLIHDDLPDIDNDDFRRGKKSCHTIFGEGVALLAGDALLLSAFELITLAELDAKLRVQFVHELAKEVGIKGLIAGQMVDIESEGKKVDKKTLHYIHENKTARLINLSLRFGALAGEAKEEELKILDEYGKLIGLVFQIVDDLLDIEGTQEELGKTIGKDAESAKATFPAVYGIAESHKKAEELTEKAREILAPLGEKALKLDILAEYLLGRKE
ncbi:MAG: polyprenyl synthetase family protein, partial [Candidatus Cloacimonadota bacterium]|jgi:geranylgeranyl diphosphate synthase type II|uniref:Geranylgeranyl pyrophosphate synthetase homolog (GGPP synthetase) (Farnesyltranstransferase) n=1 Tax=Cloacimonas acidaminovorans (strain Evry) TaxID=459349 RepID=B0VEZ6_CLOAI|nr:farnesyl diphosphate synthase [Candidatus Cloacimonas acidaminovorans]MBP8705806.1 polyprenyl synthetase family protein [Candidatus Cloacimonas sp.]MDI9571822.1 polyprenyl synthetase family protein [Candidatus Cloacimonadota bacterium]OQC72253.1 MAG: Farnesyl diphosphate synthase [Candidatus Cloacimonetes bacterium ADurb.Bin003]MDY0218779.1 polyprenyl synthetase family protein [Candidatus Cloacimonas acidaminovorans]CAO80231.1 Geranylgeranyl pyrophosphate synthetase homolog (GGPP synthetase